MIRQTGLGGENDAGELDYEQRCSQDFADRIPLGLEAKDVFGLHGNKGTLPCTAGLSRGGVICGVMGSNRRSLAPRTLTKACTHLAAD